MKIIVIGAGPSGLMCSYKLKEKGFDVLLLEKNEKVAKKVYITGKGRCNITNNCSKEDFFSNVVNNPKFLFSAYNNFTSQDTMEFFESRGVKLIVERGNRVYPASYNPHDIVSCLYNACKESGVNIKLSEPVLSINKKDNYFVVVTKKNTYDADKVVIATGGKSYAHTGTTGDGYKFAQHFCHTIIEPVPALITLRIKEEIPPNLYRFTFKNVSLRVITDDFKKEEFGEITFYKEGVAGATALTLSSMINRIDPNKVNIEIDFKPALDVKKLDARVIREIQSKENKTVKEVVHKLLPKEIVDWFLIVSRINGDLETSTLSKEVRESIVNNLKAFKLTYIGLDDIDRAVVTSGGVSTKEVNPNTLESKLVPGLYFSGEVLDVDCFTGGYNLQTALCTGALISKKLA